MLDHIDGPRDPAGQKHLDQPGKTPFIHLAGSPDHRRGTFPALYKAVPATIPDAHRA